MLGNFYIFSIDSELILEELISIDEELNCLYGFIKDKYQTLSIVKYNQETKTVSQISLGKFSSDYLCNDFAVNMNKYHYNFNHKLIAFYNESDNQVNLYNSTSLDLNKSIPAPIIPKEFKAEYENHWGFLNVYFSPCNELLLIECMLAGPDAYYPSFGYSVPAYEQIDFESELCTALLIRDNLILSFKWGSCFHEGVIAYRSLTQNNRTMKFVCLANSFKEGGRCLAGIELDTNNNPRIVNGHPKWIRQICNTPHGEVHTHLVSHINILDIIEVEITNYQESNNYQSENAYFRESSLRVIGNYDNDELDRLCDNRNLIFGNKGKAVSEEAIGNTTFSLMFIKVTTFEVIEKTYEDNPNKSQIRLVFSFKGNQYDLPVTDPVFLHRYQSNPDFLENYNQLYVSLSLGVEWKGWYYKLIAGITLSQSDDNVNVIEDNNLPF